MPNHQTLNHPSKQVKIDYDDGLNKFVIYCPFWANDLVCAVPARTWNKKRRGWAVPPTRKNIEFMKEKLIGPNYADVTKTAAHQIKVKSEQLKQTATAGFPSWYQFKTKPRKHQERALAKLYGLTAMAMFMDRGTGKTKTTIDIACALRMEGKIDAMLVVVKLSGRRTWQEEFAEHSPLPASIYLPYTDKVKEFERWLVQPDEFKVMVIGVQSLSQGSMIKMAERYMLSYAKPFMVIDESHHISSHKAIRSVACVNLGRMAKYRAALTGTPISTGPLNLFMQFEYLDPDIVGIGDFYSFRNRYAVMGGFTDDRGRPLQIIGYQNIDELTKTVAPFTFEVKKDDVLDLPPKVYKKVYVQMGKKQRQLYDQIKKEGAYSHKGTDMVVKNVLELALRLHQVCGGYVTTYIEKVMKEKIKRVTNVHAIIPWQDNPKIQELLEITNGDKQVIIWCAYRAEIEAVCSALRATYPGEVVCELHGGISEDDRNRAKNEFQTGRCKFLVGNTATGGETLTLTACEIMIYFNNTEKLIDRLQSEDRAHRDGLKHSVLYIDLIAEKTVDETIIRSLGQKMDLSEYIRLHIRDAMALLDGTSTGQDTPSRGTMVV